MATVWAYRESAFTDDSTGGWSHTVNFASLADLRTKFDGLGFAHRPSFGHSRSWRPAWRRSMDGAGLSPNRAAASGYSDRTLVSRDAGLRGGVAGAKTQHRFLADAVSVPCGRVIVAFSTWGQIDTSFGAANAPGNVRLPRAAIFGQAPRLTPWCDMRSGPVVVDRSPPAEEQRLNPGNRCANPDALVTGRQRAAVTIELG